MKKKIEELTKKIKDKPKLYKILKIIKFLCNLLAYGIALFTLLSLLITSCDNNHKQVVAYGDYNNKPIVKNAWDGWAEHTGYAVGISEFGNQISWGLLNQYFSNIYSDYTSYRSDYNSHYELNVTGLYFMNISSSSLASYTDYYNYGSSHNDTQITRILIFNGLYYAWSSDPNENVMKGTENALQFRFANGNTLDLRLCNYDGIINIRFTLFDSVFNKLDFEDWKYGFFCADDCTIGNAFNFPTIDDYWETPTINYDEGFREGYSTGIRIGQSSGYDRGYGLGYDNGYDEGYSSGLTDGAVSGVSSPFELLRGAFDSMASILNIQILPNLTLGVLIFVPLIVTIIIVVVKMFRG